jgi:UDP-2,3-diacylglucosamine pyrophosphatase LpxH
LFIIDGNPNSNFLEVMKIEALFISDVHLGSRGSNPDKLLDTLKLYQPKKLFLVGDIIDGWLLKRNFRWPNSHTKVIQKLLKLSKSGTKIIYISGNHDEFLREYGEVKFGNIELHNEYVWKNTLITHGDLYDGVVQMKWLALLGSVGYDTAIMVDRFLKRLGMKRSLSKFLKDKVKEAVKFMTNFENELVRQAEKRGCTIVICGHIHQPADKMVGEVRYLNCGDWVENNTYIIYNKGKYECISYKE